MLTFSSHLDGYQDVADQMIRDLQRRALEEFRRQDAERESLTTVAAFEAHREKVRAAFLKALGGLPQERTPLNARCTGKIERPGFVIEKIIYESQPGFYVTSALYLPAKAEGPLAAVIFVHGHADTGKSYANYQRVCTDLVNNGFAVFAVDPPGQGERFQYYDIDPDRRKMGGCTGEHTYAGLQYTLTGSSIARHFIWDAMRGLDYLAARPEIDIARVGVTGNSGGGLQTSFLMLAEPRFAAAIPCTFPMTLESYLKTGQPQDSEQIVPGCFLHGPDHHHFLTGLAPRPVMVGAVAWDFFPIEGTLEAVERARRIYRLYGKEDLVDIAIAPSRHEYAPPLRQAAVNWFRAHLQGATPDFVTGTPDPLPESALHCTPSGQILDALPESKTTFALNREYLSQLFPARKKLASDAGRQAHREAMRQAAAESLGLPEGRDRAIYPRVIAETRAEGYAVEKIYFFSAPDIAVSGVMIHPKEGVAVRQTDLALLENGTADIPERKAWLEAWLAEGIRLFVFDVRGVGGVASRPITPGDPDDTHAHEFRLACDAMMLGLSTMGLRVFDALRGYDYLRTRKDVGKIGIRGVGTGALYAFFAAVLEGGFSGAAFEDMLYSYRALAETREYNRDLYNLKIAPYGLLKRCDLVDLLPCLPPDAVEFIRPRDARGEIVAEDVWQKEFTAVAQEFGYREGEIKRAE
ncbi:MAG: acetylxylan esterase [Armatimonadetes bacterium]|nr:acetylxylan esterase [Armatimonadota bacterium]